MVGGSGFRAKGSGFKGAYVADGLCQVGGEAEELLARGVGVKV
jgi:hypothetical protein